MLLGLPFLAAVTLASQSPQAPPPQRRADPPALPAKSVTATHAAQQPVIDGRDDDAVWREATPITEFQEWRPSEGGSPKLPTVAKVAYDAANLYVFVRAFDPHPDSIITVLARRDYFTPSDMIWLFLDSYHDRRTGFEFVVNPSGVKLDAQIYNDGNEDFAWDAVWDVATPSAGRRSSGSRCRSFPTAANGAIPSASPWIATSTATPSASAGRSSGSRRRGSCHSSVRSPA
jgi:hypothetical protein